VVLSTAAGGGGLAAASPPRSERGSQALELALLLPAVALLLALFANAALLGGEVVMAQGLAREAARAAAVGDERQARAVVEHAAGRRPVRVRVTPSTPPPTGTLVSAHVELRSRAFSRLGLQIWIPARAAMQAEGR
jgi:hypothetical protein